MKEIEKYFELEQKAKDELAEAIISGKEDEIKNKKNNLEILKEKRKNLYIFPAI